ncbi:hypothetical protein JX266_004555 [Neoarthrinium moseri]|uniref:uncharacterized protein n=1 Tax=Neoarthrinium moseri TaxID=1658444 RepID=UPI001FDB4345|nr:uncharacterized protein JN550_006509 [Neoarthrinium moseri]KAI1849606.1 hypothetical protein JX266_004555 [Neoarthrinium moseri]KAI1868021.1 hypothetical protein JN550_006509 [Neoarthrinium moseri]
MERPARGARGSRPPLRTYSKRDNMAACAEPPTKKRRTDTAPVRMDASNPAAERAIETESSPQPLTRVPIQAQMPPPTALPSAPVPKKGTILSYFKVRSPSSATSSSPCAMSSGPVIPSSTPPSSPPVVEASRKKPRRLTTKPLHRSESPEQKKHEVARDKSNEPQQEELNAGSMVLQPTNSTSLNRKRGREVGKSEAEKHGGARRLKSKHTTQTTLSLSLTEKQFEECAECNMLYNPYHEKDVKMHARRHAALKSKQTNKAVVRV